MEKTIYVDQSADVLQMKLIGGHAVDTTQFSILEEGVIEHPLCTARAGIIGASHFLAVHLGQGRHFTEVLACTDVHVPDDARTLALNVSVPAARTSINYDVGCMRAFRCVTEKCPWDKGSDLMEQIEALAKAAHVQSGAVGLIHEFPGADGDNRRPLTIVFAMLAKPAPSGIATLDTKTVHAYPNEDMIVFSRSRFTLNFNQEVHK